MFTGVNRIVDCGGCRDNDRLLFKSHSKEERAVIFKYYYFEMINSPPLPLRSVRFAVTDLLDVLELGLDELVEQIAIRQTDPYKVSSDLTEKLLGGAPR